jgi:hypothetical protein
MASYDPAPQLSSPNGYNGQPPQHDEAEARRDDSAHRTAAGALAAPTPSAGRSKRRSVTGSGPGEAAGGGGAGEAELGISGGGEGVGASGRRDGGKGVGASGRRGGSARKSRNAVAPEPPPSAKVRRWVQGGVEGVVTS